MRVVPECWHSTLLTEKRDGSGLLYRRNRYYDPSSSRFTQEDPIGLAGGLNAYGFANGNPVGYSDPFGLAADPIITSWGALRHVMEKHVLGLQGPASMFTSVTDAELRSLLQETVQHGVEKGRRIHNGEMRITYERTFNRVIGTEGQRTVRVVVSERGGLRTGHPISRGAFVRSVIGGAVTGAALMFVDHLTNPDPLNAGERRPREPENLPGPSQAPLPHEPERFRPQSP